LIGGALGILVTGAAAC